MSRKLSASWVQFRRTSQRIVQTTFQTGRYPRSWLKSLGVLRADLGYGGLSTSASLARC